MIIFIDTIDFVIREYLLSYGSIFLVSLSNMYYSYLGLARSMQNIRPADIQIIEDSHSLILEKVMLVMAVLTVLRVDFWRFMTSDPYSQKLLLTKGG